MSEESAKKDLEAARANAPTSAGTWSPEEQDIADRANAAAHKTIGFDSTGIDAGRADLAGLTNTYLGRLNGTPNDATATAVGQAQRQIGAGGVGQALNAGAAGGQMVGQVGTAQDAGNMAGATTANQNSASALIDKVRTQLAAHAANLENGLKADKLNQNMHLAQGDRALSLKGIQDSGANGQKSLDFAGQESRDRFAGQIAGAGLSGLASGAAIAGSMGAFKSASDGPQLTDPSQTFGSSYGSTPSAGASFSGSQSLAPPINPFSGAPMANMPSANSWGATGGLSENMGSLQMTYTPSIS